LIVFKHTLNHGKKKKEEIFSMWKRMPGFTSNLTPLLQGLGLTSTPSNSTDKPYDPKEIARMSDPKTFGPGQWQAIHIYAKHATTDETKRAFVDYIMMIANNLKCEKCRMHALDYLAKNPLKDYFNIKNAQGVDIGMLKWTWIFHNSVNSRLGKPLMDWETCYAIYGDSNSGVCQKDCGEDAAIGVTASTRQSEPETPVETVEPERSPHVETPEKSTLRSLQSRIPSSLGIRERYTLNTMSNRHPEEEVEVPTLLNGSMVYSTRKIAPNFRMTPKNI
jgi:hypothetical protein